MKKIALSLIRFYQKYLNWGSVFARPLFLTDQACRFRPTCSEYTYLAIEKHGIIKGTLLSIKRIVRCHPFSQGGFDPIP